MFERKECRFCVLGVAAGVGVLLDIIFIKKIKIK